MASFGQQVCARHGEHFSMCDRPNSYASFFKLKPHTLPLPHTPQLDDLERAVASAAAAEDVEAAADAVAQRVDALAAAVEEEEGASLFAFCLKANVDDERALECT
jgi:hypothetical protein